MNRELREYADQMAEEYGVPKYEARMLLDMLGPSDRSKTLWN